MADRPVRPGSLLTGHRVRKTKHLAQQKQKQKERVKEKRPKEADEEDVVPVEKDEKEHSEDSSAPDAQPTAQPKKQKQSKKSRKLDPLALQETDTNIFSLEVAEVLKEVRTDYAHLEPMEKALHSLRKFLMQLEDRNIDLEDDVPACLQLQNGKQSQIKFRFKHPRSVKLAGSYALHTVASVNANLDLAVEIPSECFSATKDLKNHRYTDKRALYVHVLATAVEQTLGGTFDVKLAPWHGDVHKPVVALRMRAGSAAVKSFEIRLVPVLSNTTFDADKLLPNVNNYHRNSHPDETQPHTPQYNLAILEDMLLLDSLTMLHDALAAASAPIVDALLLLKTWLALRNAEQFSDSVTGFHLTVLVAYLLQERRLGTHLTALQAFRIALDFIATVSAAPAFSMGSQPPADRMALFSASYDVVMLDAAHKMNLWGRVSRQAWAELQHEAQLAVAELNSLRLDAVPLLLQRPVAFAVRFDAYARIRLPAPPSEPSLSESNALCDVSHTVYLRRHVWELLSRGLGTRALLLRVALPRCPHWSLSENAPAAPNEVTVGMLLNLEAAFRVLDLGPSPEQKEAATQFREWWGERAELRRFKDGSILESVVWEEGAGVAASSAPHTILHRVICHVLARHANVAPAAVHFYDDQLAFALLRHGREQRNTSASIIAQFDKFQRQVRALPELRLPIRAMHPTSAAFRYMEPWPVQPLPKHGAGISFATPLEIVMQLESSGAWPDDLEAIKCVRAAFYIHLGQLITQHLSLRTQVTAEFLDVFCEGFVFRLYIHHERELVLFERAATDSATRHIRRRQVLRPQHSSTLHGLYSRYPALGPAVRLAKAWVHSHMLSGHIGDETTELLVASVFARPAPFSPPLSPLIAFVRFLHLLGHYEWASFALVIDPTGELGRDGVRVAQEAYEQLRNSGTGAPALFLATAYDRTESFWTRHKPTRMILHRLAAFARQAEQVLSSFLDGKLSDADLPALFHVSLREYDILIRLSDQAWPARQKRVKELKNLSGPIETIVGFEPTRLLLKELRRRFGSLALFFYNAMEGDTIAVVWKPAALEPRPFKVSAVEWSVPNAHKGTLSTNFAEVVHDIEVIGGPLISEVIVQKEHP